MQLADIITIRSWTDRTSKNLGIISDTHAVTPLAGYAFIILTTVIISSIIATLFF